jgi:16S rRNA (cytosine1402-N4)-methyltransferase
LFFVLQSGGLVNAGDYHVPVLAAELVQGLALEPGARVVDATVGGAGHSALIAPLLGPAGRLLCVDQDVDALQHAQQRLAGAAPAVAFVRGNFRDLGALARSHDMVPCQAIIADLGVSSHQLDQAERGFSFSHDAPLDMRMDQRAELSAALLLERVSEAELSKIIKEYGEEPDSRRIARALKQALPKTTLQLAQLVERAVGGRRGRRIHPATRTFQALRIAVNGELEALGSLLEQAPALLAPGGRLAIISFHSLEDRLVKRAFSELSRSCICPEQAPVCTCGGQAEFALVTRRALQADRAEADANPRSRSARLRILARRHQEIGTGRGAGVTGL